VKFALPPGLLLWHHTFYAEANRATTETSRPAPDQQRRARASAPAARSNAALDNWISAQDAPLTRPQAIRRLIEQALASASPRRRTKAEAAKASALAQRELEQVKVDDAAPAEEQERRKRRLLKGPKEFRDVLSGGQQHGKGK
jgi:hypothetical protein